MPTPCVLFAHALRIQETLYCQQQTLLVDPTARYLVQSTSCMGIDEGEGCLQRQRSTGTPYRPTPCSSSSMAGGSWVRWDRWKQGHSRGWKSPGKAWRLERRQRKGPWPEPALFGTCTQACICACIHQHCVLCGVASKAAQIHKN